MIAHTNRNLTASPEIAGKNPLDKMKNIYDLEGNYSEWTAEARNTDRRLSRGGNYYNVSVGNFLPASNMSSSYPFVTSSDCTSRSGLYVKL